MSGANVRGRAASMRRALGRGAGATHRLAHRVLDPVDDAARRSRYSLDGVLSVMEMRRFERSMSRSGESPLRVWHLHWLGLLRPVGLWAALLLGLLVVGVDGAVLVGLAAVIVRGFLAGGRARSSGRASMGLLFSLVRSLWPFIWRLAVLGAVIALFGDGLGLFLLLLVYIVSRIAYVVAWWRTDRLVLSQNGVWRFQGLPFIGARSTPRIPLSRIQVQDVRESEIEQMFGAGHVPLDSAAQDDELVGSYGPVYDPHDVAGTLWRQRLISEGKVPADGLDIAGKAVQPLRRRGDDE